MKVSLIGVGDMGVDIAKHIFAKGFELTGFDINPENVERAREAGVSMATSLPEATTNARIILLVVNTDEQTAGITREILRGGAVDATIVVVATNMAGTMQKLASEAAEAGIGFVDAPVCYGRLGAKQGTLVSLCGGSEADVSFIRPVLESYSRTVYHVGEVGAGQLAKACNNMLHWVHCVANYEVLLLAKRFGLDAQRMREILLDCPAKNGTLERWDNSKFTWHEKDMDVALEMAQQAGLSMPLLGQVDQLMKRLTPADVQNLLYGDAADYLGARITAMSKEQGGLG